MESECSSVIVVSPQVSLIVNQFTSLRSCGVMPHVINKAVNLQVKLLESSAKKISVLV